jgi:HAD superfamily hydrolase (TIGR01509 family)
MPIRAVIFDLDGTVASFNLDFRTVRALVMDHLARQGVPAQLLSLDESVFEMLRKTETWAKSSGKSAAFLETLRTQVLAITETYELEAASKTTLLPGVVDALKALRAMGLKIGLCTINSEKSVNRILERFGIAGMFDVTIPRNRVRHVKPDPEHLEAALRMLGAAPEETLVVGDSRVDMQSAKGLGAVAVGLPTGVSTIEQLMEGGADYIVTSTTDLPLLMERLNEPKA